MANIDAIKRIAKKKSWTVADLYRRFGPIPLSVFVRASELGVVAGAAGTLQLDINGGDVLPGFAVPVAELFEMPKRPGKQKEQKKSGPQPGKKNGPRRGR